MNAATSTQIKGNKMKRILCLFGFHKYKCIKTPIKKYDWGFSAYSEYKKCEICGKIIRLERKQNENR